MQGEGRSTAGGTEPETTGADAPRDKPALEQNLDESLDALGEAQKALTEACKNATANSDKSDLGLLSEEVEDIRLRVQARLFGLRPDRRPY